VRVEPLGVTAKRNLLAGFYCSGRTPGEVAELPELCFCSIPPSSPTLLGISIGSNARGFEIDVSIRFSSIGSIVGHLLIVVV
jgi:hypothetical protein